MHKKIFWSCLSLASLFLFTLIGCSNAGNTLNKNLPSQATTTVPAFQSPAVQTASSTKSIETTSPSALNNTQNVSYLPKKNAIYEYYFNNTKETENSEVTIEKDKVKQTQGEINYSTNSKYCYLSEEKNGLRIECEYGEDFIGIKYPIAKGNSWTEEIINEGSMGGTDKVTFTITATDKEIETPAGTFKNVVVVNQKDTDIDNYYAPGIGIIRQDFMKKPIFILNNIGAASTIKLENIIDTADSW